MSITKDFLKLRSSNTPKTGEWNKNYEDAMAKAKKDGKIIVTAWSNGDNCSYCILAEQCMLTTTFKNWLKKQEAYFVFQYSGDKDKGMKVHDWVYAKHKITVYPGFRITRYDPQSGKVLFDQQVEGNKLRNNKKKEDGAKEMVAALDAIFASAAPQVDPTPAPDPVPQEPYVTRLNESLTTKQINKVLDAIDKNDGYCPCQPKGEGTKCHCKDFLQNKKIGEPCICNIYVKMEKK